MKLIKIKPRLVDHALLHKPIPIRTKPIAIKKPTIVPESGGDYSGIFNLIGLLILCIVGLIMYQRWNNRDKMEMDKVHSIIGLNQYVKDSLKHPQPDTQPDTHKRIQL